jgi:hypothetical protein
MHRAGESAGNAATSAGHAVEHTYHGAATALKDTAITAKVKTALHEDKSTKDSDIYVTTIAGVVTLTGSVPSSEISEHAQHAPSRQPVSKRSRINSRLRQLPRIRSRRTSTNLSAPSPRP